MEDQNLPPEDDSTSSMYVPQPRRRKLHWIAAFSILVGVTGYFAFSSHKSAEAAPLDASTVGSTPAVSAEGVLAKEMSSESPSQDGSLTVADAPPPVTSDPGAAAPGDLEDNGPAPNPPAAQETPPSAPSDPIEESMPEESAPMQQGSEPEDNGPAPTPVPEPAPVKKSSKKSAHAAPAAKKKHTLVYSSSKVPKALKKDKVQSYLKKKLAGNTSCVPSSLTKKQVKPFVATISLTKGGTISDVQIKPKLAQAKVIETCLKKNLAGSPALFKAKTTNKITVALKVK